MKICNDTARQGFPVSHGQWTQPGTECASTLILGYQTQKSEKYKLSIKIPGLYRFVMAALINAYKYAISTFPFLLLYNN